MIKYRCDLCKKESKFSKIQPKGWRELTFKMWGAYQNDISIMSCGECLSKRGIDTSAQGGDAMDKLKDALINVINECIDE